MSTHCALRRAAAILLILGSAVRLCAEDVTLVLDQPVAAGIAGFRALWDTTVKVGEDGVTEVKDGVVKDRGATAVWSPLQLKPGQTGPLVFDAVQRSLLVRFPDAAEKLAEQVKKGFAVKKAELVLPFKDEELWAPGGPDFVGPDGFNYRMNWGVDEMYRKIRPDWHAVAWALRKPWTAGAEGGPTWNAYVAGAGYWAHCGAQDEQRDRFPLRFGPAEVSHKNPEGRVDVTAALTDAAFGKTLGERLRTLADCGFLLQKWETYDHRYYAGAYEWATGAGGRGILIRKPKLAVTFAPAAPAPELGALPPTADVKALAEQLKKDGSGGKPTAVLPSREELARLAVKFGGKPAWMPDWQWQRVQELERLEGNPDEPFWYEFVPYHIRQRVEGQVKAKQLPAEEFPREMFGRWVDGLIGRAPRGWYGFEAAREMTQWYLYGEAMPLPARDADIAYWTAWLMPDRPAANSNAKRANPNYVEGPLIHPMADDPRVGGPKAKVPDPANGRFDSYFAATGDWRGNKSFYRSGFCYTMSTQNFNTSASAGALLGGSIIRSEFAMADGRHGIENFPLRLWTWSSGSTQEAVDHYYYAITLAGNKVVRDFGPTAFDRLLGDSMLAKGVEELVSCYHPGLRRFIAGSSRTSFEYLLVTQDGLQHIMHTLSKRGALHDLGGGELPGKMKALGHEFTPQNVARQTRTGPWAPEWVANMVDEKPLPYEAVSRYDRFWRHCYLGKHYGLASSDLLDVRIQVMAQWRREDRVVERYSDLVTLNVRYGANTTRWVNDAPGWIAPIGKLAALQHRGKMLVVGSPWPSDHIKNAVKKDGLKSLQTSVALFNYQSPLTWEICVDGQRVGKLPFTAKQGQRITIKDGVTFLGLIPLPATDLGRTAEVTLEEGTEQEFGGATVKPALVVNSYNLLLAQPAKTLEDLEKVDRACGGFVVELSDAAEYPDFAAFQKHFQETQAETRYEAEKDVYHVKCVSGKDTLECGAYSRFESGAPGGFAYRKVNGVEPYTQGFDRDTTLTQAGRTGKLEKNGAVLTCDKGRMAYLQTEPLSGTYAGFNPLPDPTTWSLTVPGGVSVTADGKLGLARVIVCPKEKKLWVDYAVRDSQKTAEGMATKLLIAGLANPTVIYNGRPVELQGGALPLTQEPAAEKSANAPAMPSVRRHLP